MQGEIPRCPLNLSMRKFEWIRVSNEEGLNVRQTVVRVEWAESLW